MSDRNVKEKVISPDRFRCYGESVTISQLADLLPPIEAAELARRREALGLTQTELAIFLGFSEPTVRRWEKGEVRIPKPVRPALDMLEATVKAK